MTTFDPAAAVLAVPDDLRIGVATSSYQIEGAVDVAGRGPSIWDTFSHTPGRVYGGHTGDDACDHYHRWDEDLDLIAWLGVDRYRFSVAWPRVMPDGDRLEQRGLDFYDRLVDGLLERGVDPVVTLYHWDLPQRLEDAGGWSSRETVHRFVAYAQAVAERLGDRVPMWSTLNEPWCAAFLGYDVGVHAPGVRDPGRAVAAAHHLLLAHGTAVTALRTMLPSEVSIGLVINPAPIRPARPTAEDEAAAHLADGLRNRIWIEPVAGRGYPADVCARWEQIVDLGALIRDGDLGAIAAPIDHLGVNYYMPVYAAAGQGAPPPGPGQAGVVDVPGPAPTTAMGWTIDAAGLEELLLRIADDLPGVTLAVTENGAAFNDLPGPDGAIDDRNRIDYLDGHLRATLGARAAGVDVSDYFVWSLMDNFEWAEGYRYPFGVVHVDRSTLARTPKASAHWLRAVLARRRTAGEASSAL